MPPQFLCSVSMGSHSVNIFSDTNIFVKALSVTGHFIPFIPGWMCSGELAHSPLRIDFIEADRAGVALSADGQSLIIRGAAEAFANGEGIAYWVYFLLEIERQRCGETTLHGAACSKQGRGILLLGDRGSGKTSILLQLCREYGYKLIGNDLVILRYDRNNRRISISAGTKIFGIRYAVARSRFPDLESKFSNSIDDGWRKKIFCYPEEVGVRIESSEVILGSAFFCHLGECGTQSFYLGRISDSWIRFNLYENLSRYIKGSALVHSLNGEAFTDIAYSPSVDTTQFHSFRVALLNCLVDQITVNCVTSSSLTDICDVIDSYVSQTH